MEGCRPYKELEQALNGLNFQSESDFPLDFVCWEKSADDLLDTAFVLRTLERDLDTPVEEGDAEDLLSSCSKVEPWFSEEEKQNALGFEKLHKLFNMRFGSKLNLFRVGEVEVTVIVLADDKNYAVGFKTTSIET